SENISIRRIGGIRYAYWRDLIRRIEGIMDTTYWMEIVFPYNVDQSILYGVSADMDKAYSLKSDNGLDLV
ncbi:hypothetical protein Tco_0051752, partial [Tanacetum coccineum]